LGGETCERKVGYEKEVIRMKKSQREVPPNLYGEYPVCSLCGDTLPERFMSFSEEGWWVCLKCLEEQGKEAKGVLESVAE